jgi:hypothetical protein
VPRLRALPHGRTLPVVAVSASVLGFNEHEAIVAGCNAFLAKPVSEAALAETLRRMLRLEWTYREAGAPPDAPPESPVVADQWPPLTTLDALTEAARPGDINAVRARIAAALSAAEPGAAFLRELEQLARSFQIAEIRQRLARARASVAAGILP